MRILYTLLIPTFIISSCTNDLSKPVLDDYTYSIDKPIEGQIHTAEKLRVYMDNKEYNEAIHLFSNTQKSNIEEIKNKPEIFTYWCTAWTFNEAKYERYLTKIKKQKAHFIFENKEWKINEK